MDIKLIIPQKIHNKYTYLLKRFKSLEWSGPAWYKIKKDKDGYPIEFKIVHFHPLDLGGHAATEWDAKDFAKIMKSTYEENPSLKSTSIGLIHSHNTMGAFLSGTDTSTIEDNAPSNGFYPSLVVASAGKALHAFGFGYQDQYKVQHCVELDEDEIEVKIPGLTPLDIWIKEADIIEKNKPIPAPGKQMNVLSNYARTEWKPKAKEENANEFELLSKIRMDIKKKYPESIQTQLDNLLNALDAEELSDINFETQAETLGISLSDIINLQDTPVNLNYYGGYGNGYYY